jgi:aspartate/methionine/tyrosine aminotransferase
MNKMPEPYNKVELFSLYSISKGYMGDCGIRGGYLEGHNIDS